KAFFYAFICTVASVLGGLAGYAIGALFFELIAEPILAFYGYSEKFSAFSDLYNEYGAWIVIAGGFTPIPYKVITIASGVVTLNPVVFVLASFGSRGARFFLVSGLLYLFGPPIKEFVERYLPWLAILAFLLLIGGFVVIGGLI
ncbi:MAG: VTT domain-containing protein, partial [Pseudomonadota bacterium]